MKKRTGVDKALHHVPKEQIGMPWTYTAATRAKLAADKATAALPKEQRLPPVYGTSDASKVVKPLPKNNKHPLQQNNGLRSQCVGYKAGAKVGNERNLPPVPKDYLAVARAKRIKKHTSKLRAAPTKKI